MDKAIWKILDKQFEMIGVNMKFSDIPENGIVTYKEGKKEKKDYWYNVYKFTEEQELEWREWAITELRKDCNEQKAKEIMLELDLLYGFVIRYKKKGELF